MGFAADPLAFTPSEHCSWTHRFDDPERRYRTLYCAEERITCLRETLATFRPDAKTVAEYRRLFGEVPDAVGSVPREWLERHALASGRIEIREGELASVDEPTLRREFARRHVDLLVAHGMEHLDISEVRSRDRIVTQGLGRFVFERAAAGVLYRSNLDDLPCVALFEGRAALTPEGEAEALADLPQELLRVCQEFGLTCSSGP